MDQLQPYISFVVAARNDDHGGMLIPRMMTFIRSLQYQCRRVELPCELVVVEWNPPPGAAPLKDILSHLSPEPYLAIRIITVPATIHHRYALAREIPLHQMAAKNVGIRRARAPFIACTNVDLVFSDALFNRLGGRSLAEGFYYRCNRCDVPAAITSVANPAELAGTASAQVIRRWGMDPDWPGLKIHSQKIFFYRNKGWRFIYPLLSLAKRLMMGSLRYRIACIDKEACGDFTLMSRGDWIDIQGYAEWARFPLHIDSLALIAAAALGKRQVIFPANACIYHIEHERAWAPAQAKQRAGFNRRMQVPAWEEIEEMGITMLREQGGYPDQPEHWGWPEENLRMTGNK